MMKMMLFSSVMSFLISLFMLNNNMFILMMIPIIKINMMSLSADIIMDWISMMFMSTVTLISSLILLFSIYYINTKEQYKFMLMMMLFILSMIILILSNNLFLLLLGWDGLGLSSYVLVIYYQNYSSAASGTITLISNRIGDILILLSMGMNMIIMNWSFYMKKEFMYLPMLFMMLAACSKSAQFPFSAWLPLAMAAPTPISALVHSSTLVTAGVYMLLRIMSNHMNLSIMLMIIASMTAIYSSLTACWEQDLKKIIAYSTLSQIAMMMFAISMNAFNLAFIHLIIHALFKSTMFLCAGTMIHESMYQDMRMMGMSMMMLSIPSSTMGITSMALMGVPFMSGFFSKDSIIENMITSNLKCMMSLLMIMSIGMTASYSIRMIFFSNKWILKSYPNTSNHLNFFSTLPMMIMGPLSISTGSMMTWMLTPEQNFMVNMMFKMSIFLVLLLGVMLGMLMSFNNKNFMKLGFTAISIWFMHILSTIPKKFSSNPMLIFLKNDKQWMENYGPNNLYLSFKNISNSIILSKKSSMLLFFMFTILIPMLFNM
uniref:NADH-ubiquinone oxidoreductase chain 5 n=1 Tax=Cheiracanthium brevispinum TaxID=2773961 RepID=A0AA51VHZ5_9ARAC|nr:NADH dehydrogenase subunit 5 [Cheiracanthium brevispinum]WMX19913.1 NADH dehydrogenase subunit 5 [Cheiracanthium brevispinum]